MISQLFPFLHTLYSLLCTLVLTIRISAILLTDMFGRTHNGFNTAFADEDLAVAMYLLNITCCTDIAFYLVIKIPFTSIYDMLSCGKGVIKINSKHNKETKQIVVKAYHEGVSVSEIVKQFDIPRSTV